MPDKFNPQAEKETARSKQGVVHRSIARFFKDTELFTAVILVLVALVSFRLGQLSEGASTAATEGRGNANAAAVQMVASSSVASTTYVGSQNSDKYHLPWCSGAQRIKKENKVVFNSRAEAEDAGYEPAANCKGL